MAGLNGDSSSPFVDDPFGLFTNGGDYLIGGSPGWTFPPNDGTSDAVLTLPITPPLSDPQPATPPHPPPPPPSDALLLFRSPDITDFYGTYPGPAVPTGAYDYGKNPEDFGPVASSPPAPLFGEGVSGPDRLYPSPPSPPTFSGPAFAPGAYDLGENPQDFWPVASSVGAAFPLEAPRAMHPFPASSPPAFSNAGEGPSGALPAWLDRPASVSAVPVASAWAAAEGPLRRASAPDYLAAFAPEWDAPWVPAPPATTTNGWTAGPAPALGPAIAFGDALPDTTTGVDWDALFGFAPAPAPALAPAWTAAATPAITTRGPPAALAPAAPTRSAPSTATTSTLLLPSTTTTLLSTANAAAAAASSRKRARSPAPPTDGPPPAKKTKAGPGRRAKYDGMSGFLVATVADAGALGHKEGPTTQVLAPRSGRWRRNGCAGGKKGGKERE